ATRVPRGSLRALARCSLRQTVPSRTELAGARRVEVREPERNHLRYAGVIHRDPVDRIGGFDRPAVVRDDDELRAVGELAQRLREAADVALVERRIDFVEHAERRGSYAEDGQEKRRRGERALAARQLRQAADPLARRSRVDVDAGLLGILARAQRGLPAVEQALKEEAELAVDGLERRAELLGDRSRELVGERAQIAHRALEIRLLCREEAVALADLAELGRGERVHRLERDEPAAQSLQRGERARLLLLL